jgi:hypothetical protein
MRSNTMTLSRRTLMGSGAFIAILGVSACGTSIAAFSAQALADVTGAFNAAGTIVSAIDTIVPGAISSDVETQIATWSGSISQLLGTLSNTTPAPAGAGTLGTIDTNLNSILTAVGPILNSGASKTPDLLPIVVIYDAAVALLPGLESYVNSVITTLSPTTTAARRPLAIAAPLLKPYTVAQARSLLHIETVATK